MSYTYQELRENPELFDLFSRGSLIALRCTVCGKEYTKSRKSVMVWYIKAKNNVCSNECKHKNVSNHHKLGIYDNLRSEEMRCGARIRFNEYWSNPENRSDQSKRMRKVAKNNPESYRGSNQGRAKHIQKYGIDFQGTWELIFYEFCIFNQISIVRNYSGFDYIWQGVRTYYPDFYLPEVDTYVEVKGYKTGRDAAKWSYFNNDLLVVMKDDIQRIFDSEYFLDVRGVQ